MANVPTGAPDPCKANQARGPPTSARSAARSAGDLPRARSLPTGRWSRQVSQPASPTSGFDTGRGRRISHSGLPLLIATLVGIVLEAARRLSALIRSSANSASLRYTCAVHHRLTLTPIFPVCGRQRSPAPAPRQIAPCRWQASGSVTNRRGTHITRPNNLRLLHRPALLHASRPTGRELTQPLELASWGQGRTISVPDLFDRFPQPRRR
jgi:hypothetical protein